MARRKMDLGPLATAIMAGEHDDVLDQVIAAAQARQKNRFRRGTRVRVTGTGDKTDGKEGVVLKANPRTITVGLGGVTFEEWDAKKDYPVYADGEWNMTSGYLEVI